MSTPVLVTSGSAAGSAPSARGEPTKPPPVIVVSGTQEPFVSRYGPAPAGATTKKKKDPERRRRPPGKRWFSRQFGGDGARHRSTTPEPRRRAEASDDKDKPVGSPTDWIMGYLHSLPRVKAVVGFVMFAVFGILFLTSDVADWAQQQFVSVSADGTVHNSITWSFPVTIVMLAAFVFLSGMLQIACGRVYVEAEGRQGVDVGGTVEALFVEPLVLSILAVAAGVHALSTIIVVVLSCATAVALTGASKLIRRLMESTPGAGAPKASTLNDLLCRIRPAALPWMFNAIAVGARVAVYGVVVWELTENAGDSAAKSAAGISTTTIVIIGAAFVAMLLCDLYSLFDVARKGHVSSAIPHAPTHSFLHTVRFLVVVVVVVGLGCALLVE